MLYVKLKREEGWNGPNNFKVAFIIVHFNFMVLNSDLKIRFLLKSKAFFFFLYILFN